VLLASHQLSGLAADWWDAYVEAHEEPGNWPEFRAVFVHIMFSKGLSS
jgi:hypothetical protein